MQLEIRFTPTHFSHPENGDLLISTKDISDFKYFLNGFGQKPTSF